MLLSIRRAQTHLALIVLPGLSDPESLDGILKLESVSDEWFQIDQPSSDEGDGHWVISRSVSVRNRNLISLLTGSQC
jgi:hypothetical protein